MVTVTLPGLGLISTSRTLCSPTTDESTAATVGLMQQYIAAGAVHPDVVAAAADALAGIPIAAPAWRKAEAIFAWIKPRFTFQTDERTLAQSFGQPGSDDELLIRPELFLRVRRGDCDDFTMLACAMLGAAGVDAHIVTIAADRNDPDRWSHVYAVVVLEDGRTLPIDASHGPYLGWEAPAYRRAEWVA